MVAEVPVPHPPDWVVTNLGRVALKIGSGATPLGGKEAYLSKRSRFALVRSQNVFDRHFEAAGLAFISDEQAMRLKGAALKEGDLLLNITGDGITFSRACAVPADVLPASVNQHVAIIRVNPVVADAGFVLAYLTHPAVKAYIEGFNAGGSRRAITKAHIESFHLALPPLPEQHAIADILGALDDKIDLSRRMSETLEAIAQALFRSWFVDFDPVRDKAEGRELSLSKEVADLFPVSLQKSGLGEIPRGWKVSGLDEIADFRNGLALQRYPPTNGSSLPVIKIAQLRIGRTDGREFATANLAPEYIAEDGDVLFSWSGTLECVVWSGGKGAVNQHLFKVTSSVYPKWFYYLWIHQHLEHFRNIAAGKATTMGHIQRHHLSEAKVVLPPPAVLQALDVIISPLIEGHWRRRVQSRVLAALRDTLLPKLISGELRIQDPDRIIGRHA